MDAATQITEGYRVIVAELKNKVLHSSPFLSRKPPHALEGGRILVFAAYTLREGEVWPAALKHGDGGGTKSRRLELWDYGIMEL